MNEEVIFEGFATAFYGELDLRERGFADLPAFGIWADRTETDGGLLEESGKGWRGFAKEDK